MTRRLREKVDHYEDDNYSGHLECPRCGRHNIVRRGEDLFICLNCRWERDISRHRTGEDGPFPFLIILAIVTVIFIILTSS